MALAPFFDRVYGAVGKHLSATKETLATALASAVVGLDVGRSERANDIWIADLSVNLLARLYPTLALTGRGDHRARCSAIARAINPDIEILDRADGANVQIAVGSSGSGSAIMPSASGWVARLTRVPEPSGADNPYAAGTAACLAVSEVFRRILLGTASDRDIELSILDYSAVSGDHETLMPHDAGDVLVAGVGAVGNAALWALSRDATLATDLTLLDPERLTLANMQRYALGTLADLDVQKVDVAAREFTTPSVKLSAVAATLEEYADSHDGAPQPTIMISVDNVDGRRAAQALLPRLVVNGWTGDEGLGASWHELSRDAACLACLYHPRGPRPSATEQAAAALGLDPVRAAFLWVSHQGLNGEDIERAASALGVTTSALQAWRGKPLGDLYSDVLCGAAPIDLSKTGRVESVPLAHQSALAGILMAAELVKRTDASLSRRSQVEPLVSWENVLREPPAIWAQPRAREDGCICGDQDYQAVYAQRWQSSPI
jgi:hypothetical protein